ncbi:MAG: CdaR family protein [Myxococcales bacterium]|jgi:hypothetical protein
MLFGLLRFLRAILTENVGLKVVSFLIALGFYSFVHGTHEAQRSVFVNILARTPEDPNRVLLTQLPPQVRVTLRGPKALLDELRPDEIDSVQVDLRHGTETRVYFDPHLIRVPEGLLVEQVEPSALPIEWEDRIVVDVPVRTTVVGIPSAGLVVQGGAVADPSRVQVRGPASEVLVLQHVPVEPFDASGLSEGRVSRRLALERPRGRVTWVVPSVTVSVEVVREMSERVFSKVPVAIVGPLKAKAQPPEVDVRVTCPPEQVRALRIEQVVARVQPHGTGEHGNEVVAVVLGLERCEVSVTPAAVIVRW